MHRLGAMRDVDEDAEPVHLGDERRPRSLSPW
jgi:hypothetical protein